MMVICTVNGPEDTKGPSTTLQAGGSQPSTSTPMVAEMHKEALQATSGQTSLGVTGALSKDRVGTTQPAGEELEIVLNHDTKSPILSMIKNRSWMTCDEADADAFIDTDDTIPKSPPALPNTLKIRELTNQGQDLCALIPVELKVGPTKMDEVTKSLGALKEYVEKLEMEIAKLTVLDAFVDIMNKVALCLDKFADVISLASYKAKQSGGLSAGQVVTSPAEGEKTTKANERPSNQPIIL
ncbi:hypothetical protein Tco_0214857 [Tanacetum coccineum]